MFVFFSLLLLLSDVLRVIYDAIVAIVAECIIMFRSLTQRERERLIDTDNSDGKAHIVWET